MSDMIEERAEDTGPEPTPAEALEALILLSHRFARDVANSTEFAGRSLSLDAFAVLVTMGSEPATASAKIGKRAAAGEGLRRGRKELLAAGLIAKTAAAEGKDAEFTLTDKGRETLGAVRASFGQLTATETEGASVKSWKSIPRLARMTRVIGRKLVSASTEAAKLKGARMGKGERTGSGRGQQTREDKAAQRAARVGRSGGATDKGSVGDV